MFTCIKKSACGNKKNDATVLKEFSNNYQNADLSDDDDIKVNISYLNNTEL
jgi:hypothetical protein